MLVRIEHRIALALALLVAQPPAGRASAPRRGVSRALRKVTVMRCIAPCPTPVRGAPIALVALATAGCVGYGPQGLSRGAPEQAVVQRMGPPTGVYPRPEGGRRLEFARGPMGRHTFMVDLDPGGRVLQWEQVLTEARFNALQAGLSRQEVLYRLGRPSHEMHIPRRHERVWSYRYESPFCQWFQVSLDTRTDRVTQTGYNVDPLCDANDREDR